MTKEAPPIPTMEYLPDHGVTHINVWCGRWPHQCDHSGRVSLANIDARQTILQFASKLVCTECGAKGGQAMPVWPKGGGYVGGAHRY